MAWTPFRSGQASRLAEPSGTARRGNSFPASRNGGPASGNASSRSPPVRRHGTQAMPPRIRTARRRGYPSCPDSWRHSLAIRRRRHLRATSCRMNRPTKPTPMTVPASQWRYSTSRSIIPLSPRLPSANARISSAIHSVALVSPARMRCSSSGPARRASSSVGALGGNEAGTKNLEPSPVRIHVGFTPSWAKMVNSYAAGIIMRRLASESEMEL